MTVLCNMKLTMSQDGNTIGTTEEYEDLTIELETQLPGDEPFFVIKTSSGWSFDAPKELEHIMAAVMGAWNNIRAALK